MKVIYEEGKDLGLENWRIKANVVHQTDTHYILIKIENFQYGFVESSYDELFYERGYTREYYREYVSVISKNRHMLESYLDSIILKLKEIVEYNINKNLEEIRYHEKSIELCKEVLNSELYKSINRDSKLDNILNQK